MEQPVLAVFGCSDTGMWEDSPCPSKKINDSIDKVEKILEDNGIKSEKVWTRSSNLFMIKRWLVVDKEDFKKAKETVKNIELSDCCHLW